MSLTKTISGTFKSTGVNKPILLPYVPYRFSWWNKTQYATTVANTATSGVAFSSDAKPTGYVNASTGTASNGLILINSTGVQFFQADTFRFGPVLTITGIVAATGIVTTSAAHGLAVGDTVWLYGTTGMLQIAGTATTVTAVGSTTTFTIGNIPTAGFAANATAGFAKKVLYADLYIPYGCIVTAVTAAAQAVVTTSVNHQFCVGQEVFFVMPQTQFTGVWGMGELDSAAYVTRNGIPQQAYVTAVTANTITVNINSTGFTAFAYPTSAQAAFGVTFPQVLAIGDQNSGGTLVPPLPIFPSGQSYTSSPPGTPALTIPGAWFANTRQGVILPASATATGPVTAVLHANNDFVEWEAMYPDGIMTPLSAN